MNTSRNSTVESPSPKREVLGSNPSGRAIPFGVVAQLVSAPTCRVEGYGFESRRRRHFKKTGSQAARRLPVKEHSVGSNPTRSAKFFFTVVRCSEYDRTMNGIGEQINQLRSQGLSYRDIESRLGCARSTISYHCGQDQKSKAKRRRQRWARVNVDDLKTKAGGACSECGYNACLAAIDFHHVDPTTKDGLITQIMRNVSYKKAEEEAAKCVLLCANCHREFHAGVRTLRQRP